MALSKNVFVGQTMHIASTAVLLFILFLVQPVKGQELTRDDFNVGFLKLNSSFDSVLIHLGRPNNTEVDANDRDFIGFYYPTLIVFKNNRTNLLASLHIHDTSFVTQRGLRVGDSTDKLTKLYGNTGQTTKKFWAYRQNDHSFQDYSEATAFHQNDFHFVVFTKHQRVVKMLSYFDRVLSYDDFAIGFLKLGSTFDFVASQLGEPDSTTQGNLDATGYHYPRLVLWRNSESGLLWAFDIYDTSLATLRGVRVGDSISTIERAYGNCRWETRRFERIGPYDLSFNDYSEYALLDKYDHVFILFTKNKRLVKMLFYLGVEE